MPASKEEKMPLDELNGNKGGMEVMSPGMLRPKRI